MTSLLEKAAQQTLRDAGALKSLNQRALDIFRRIVESYIATGEPVGSRNLSLLMPTPLSPASIRNTMQSLEDIGLIFAPHTSAGRLPTELGLRFFVEALLEIGDIATEERAQIERQIGAADNRSMETLLTDATAMLSGMSLGAGVVVTHKDNGRLKQIEFVRLESERALAILVAEDGSVENRVLPIPRELPASALVEAANYLNARIRGRTLADARAEIEGERSAAQGELDQLTARLVEGRAGDDDDDGDGLALLAPARQEIEVRVADTGIGIPPRERPRVFDPFYQVDSSSTREFGGTGLGLSIVKRLVEAHQGTIRIEGNEPTGAVFVVRIPTASSAAAVGHTIPPIFPGR